MNDDMDAGRRSTKEPVRTLAWRVARDPTSHFVLLAAVLFLVSAVIDAVRGPVLVINRADLEWRILEAELASGSPLTAEDRRRIEEQLVEERVLIEEARRLGLDDDERINDILVQKMLHVLSGDVIQPTDDEIRAYYAEQSARYAAPTSVFVDEVTILEPGSATEEVPARLRKGVDLDDLRREGMRLNIRSMRGLTIVDLDQLFGSETAELVFASDSGTWLGPFDTPRGDNWLRVSQRSEASVVPLDQVHDAVRLDWIAEREEARLAQRVRELRARYSVEMVGEPSAEP